MVGGYVPTCDAVPTEPYGPYWREIPGLPIRIYALAKELGVEYKVITDLCGQLGIAKGKSSALANLTDEEAAQVRAVHGRSSGGGASSAPTSGGGSAGAKRGVTRPAGRVTDRIVSSLQDTPLRQGTTPPSDPLRKIPVLKPDRGVSVDVVPVETTLVDIAPVEIVSPDTVPSDGQLLAAVPESVADDMAPERGGTAAVAGGVKSGEEREGEPQPPVAPPFFVESVADDPSSSRSSETDPSVSADVSGRTGAASESAVPPQVRSVETQRPVETLRPDRSTDRRGGDSQNARTSPLSGALRQRHQSDRAPDGRSSGGSEGRGRDERHRGERGSDGRSREGRGRDERRGGGPSRREPVRTMLSSQVPQVPIRPDHLSSPTTPIRDMRDAGMRNLNGRRDGTSGSADSGVGEDAGAGNMSGAGGESDRRRGPAIRLAPVPATPVSKPTRTVEPTPQKPQLRLRGDGQRMDGGRVSRMGDSPLTGHLRRQGDGRLGDGRGGGRFSDGQRGDRPVSGGAVGASPGFRDGAGRPGRGESGRGESGRGGIGAAGGRPYPGRGGSEPGAVFGRDGRGSDRGGERSGSERGGDRNRDRRRRDEDESSSLAGRDGRQLRRRQQQDRGAFFGDDEDSPRYRGPRRRKQQQEAVRRTTAVVELPCTVRSFSETAGIPVMQILKKMMDLGSLANINSDMDRETVDLIGMEFGIEVTFREQLSAEEEMIESFRNSDDPERMRPRPPIVTFLGHVDHGKTSLLDGLLKLDVARGEKGGITQHIRAYSIEQGDQRVTFVDTPGHEAFTAMRARGANATDIAVLVVAADDGVMPQTEEAISHAKAADVPIIVALNKMDIPGAEDRIQRIYAELLQNGLTPTEWGGDTEVVRTSATTGVGLNDLLDTILVVAEVERLEADPTCPATGICLESEVEQGRGVIAKLLVQKGTLHAGDVVVCGEAYGRVKAMHDTLRSHKKYRDAGPSMPVNITGLNVAPGAGDRFHVLADIAVARQIAEDRQVAGRQRDLVGLRTHVTLENLFDRLQERTDVQTLSVILRADVRGSIEAIRKELEKLDHSEVQVQIIQAMVGGVTEADVHLADASDAIIIGFNVVPDERARALAEQLGVQVRRYDIIYQVTEELKAALEGMLKPEQRTTELGRALVQQVFNITRVGTVAGCRVISGVIQRDGRARIIRDSRVIGDYLLDSLKREKDDAKEVREGYECGIRLAGYDDIKQGDILEVYRIEEVKRTLN